MGKVYCPVCEVTGNNPSSFCDHLSGLKHRTLMVRHHPKDLPQLYRVQYILDTYMQSYPIVGLEYVAEMRGETSYYYTCELCKVGRDWREMIVHVTGVEHAKLFMERHYSHMAGDANGDLPEDKRLIALEAIAKDIFNKKGRKKIRTMEPDVLAVAADSSPGEGGKNIVALPPAGHHSVNPQKGAAGSESALPRRFDGKKHFKPAEHLSYPCNLCGIYCSRFTTLCEHIGGNKHKKNLQRTAPQDLKNIHRLSFFLSQYMKGEPLLGLEYVTEEEEEDGLLWRFFCQLCDEMESKLLGIVNHITTVGHKVNYIKKHHGDLWTSHVKNRCRKSGFAKVLREITVKILKEHGSKDIKVKLAPHKSTTLQGKPGKTTKASREDDARLSDDGGRKGSQSKRPSLFRETESRNSYEKALKKSGVDDPPLAKRGRLYREEDREALPSKPETSQPRDSQQTERQASSDMSCLEEEQESSPPRSDTPNPMDLHPPTEDATLEVTTAIQELEFHTNDQILEYLADFRIDDDQDAAFIQVITQNCIAALTRFQEEEITRQHESLLASASRTLPEISVDSVNEARSPSPEPETTSDPSSELCLKNDITETPEVLVNEARSPEPETTSDPSSEVFMKNDISETLEVLVNEVRSPSPELVLPVDKKDQSLELLPKNDITDLFSSIKDMDESEVVGVFQRIATTNPKFQGIDIPAIIRLLKH